MEGRPQGTLRKDLSLVGLPSLAFLDSAGQVLIVVPFDARDLVGLRTSARRAHRYVELRAASDDDPRAAAEFLILQLEERQLTLPETEKRFEFLQEIEEPMRARIQTLILDLRIGEQLRATRDDRGKVIGPLYAQAGKEFLERLRTGPHPSVQVSRGYWYAMLDGSYAANDVDGMRLALESFEANLKQTAPGKAWVGPLLDRYRVQLQELEDGAAKKRSAH